MKTKLALALATIAALAFPQVSVATFSPDALSQVASAFASRKVKVICESAAEDSILAEAWGYVWVPPGEQNETYIHQFACKGAQAIASDDPSVSDWSKAVGAEVLVHESYHLKRVRWNTSEAITECRAMRHYDVVLAKLGASEAEVYRLMPLMLLDHYRLGEFAPEYAKPSCGIPKRYDKYRGKYPGDNEAANEYPTGNRGHSAARSVVHGGVRYRRVCPRNESAQVVRHR